MFHKIDNNGFYLGVSKETNDGMEFYTEVQIVGNFIKFKFDGNDWVEGATEEEIAEFNKQFVPFEVPLWAMRTVLKQANLFDAIIGAIQTLDEPIRSIALGYLEYGNYIERHSATVGMIQQITGLSESQVDDLFINANDIKL